MAVYFDYQVQPVDEDSIFTILRWHKTYPLLAAALQNENHNKGIICFYLDEGEPLENCQFEKNVFVSCLSWHPAKKILAIGWKSGEVTTWNENGREVYEVPLFHKAAVTNILWNGTGTKLMTSDESGILCVSKVDQKGRLQPTPMFQHDLGSHIIKMVLKLAVGGDVAADIAAAARAAVSGDENALDMFDWQQSGRSKFSIGQAESIQIYLGTSDGSIYFLDDRGKCNKCFQVEGAVKSLLYYETGDVVLTVTENLLLTQHSCKEGEYSEMSKVKLSGKALNFSVIWAGVGLIATSCKERVVRILDIDNDQNFVLNLEGTFQSDECINSLSFNQSKGILSGGTNHGHVVFWKYCPMKSEDNRWEFQPASVVEGSVQSVEWGGNRGLLVSNSQSTLTILSQSVMNCHFNSKIAAVQITPNNLSVETFPSGVVNDLKTDVHIKGVFCSEKYVAIWNGKKIAVYEVSDNKSLVRAAGSFNSDAQKIGLFEQNIYIIEPEKISVRTFQGTVKQEITFQEHEGDPYDLNICGTFMAVATNKSFLKIFDLSRREARQVSSTKNLEESVPNFGRVQTLKCNCNGTKVAFTSETANNVTSSFLYVWDVESDTMQCFNFSTGTGSDMLEDELARTQEQLTAAIKGYVPKAIYWDFHEPKLLVSEVHQIPMASNEKNSFLKKTEEAEEVSVLIVTMFSTPDHGIIVHDHSSLEPSCAVLLGVDVPYYYYRKTLSEGGEGGDNKQQVVRKTLRDFNGLEDADDSVKTAMLNFCFLSAIGNMDEAFKTIKSIKSGSVWENMCRMCVKTKRLDVAMVCLGNMGNAAAAKAVRECANKDPEFEAHIAMLAIQIGMYVSKK